MPGSSRSACSHHYRPYGRSQFFRIPAVARSLLALAKLWWNLVVRRRT